MDRWKMLGGLEIFINSSSLVHRLLERRWRSSVLKGGGDLNPLPWECFPQARLSTAWGKEPPCSLGEGLLFVC